MTKVMIVSVGGTPAQKSAWKDYKQSGKAFENREDEDKCRQVECWRLA